MTATLIDGRKIAFELRQDIATRAKNFMEVHGKKPGLAVVLVGDNPASRVYVKNKVMACEKAGIGSEVLQLDARTHEDEVISQISRLNENDDIHGILVQLPMPATVDTSRIITHLAPHKDVDGLHPQNLGLLFAGRPNLVPCTPLACLHLIRSVMPNLTGKRAVVVGRSLLVGRPISLLLTTKNATVVQAHSHTQDLAQECQRADILVAAVGNPGLITKEHIKPGAVVIDVGINRVVHADGTLTLRGDVVFEEAQEVAGYITPVPGGVGPMTVTYLLMNTLLAAEKAKS